jgi:hypothetical protein
MSRRRGVERIAGARATGVLTSALLTILAACGPPQTNSAPPAGGGTGSHPLSALGVAILTPCENVNPHPASRRVVRIRIPDDVGELLRAQPVPKHVKFIDYATNDAADSAPDDDVTNQADDNSAYAYSTDDGQPTNMAANPYNSDLTNKGYADNETIKYVLLIPPTSSFAFLSTVPDPLIQGQQDKVRGVLATPNTDIQHLEFVCVDPLRPHAGQPDRRATFWVTQHHSNSPKPVLTGFNIVLVPTGQAKGTPIIIDPKILNNG